MCDRNKTGLPYQPPPDVNDDWLRLRREEAMTAGAIVRLAEAAHARYGVKHFKLKGACYPVSRFISHSLQHDDRLIISRLNASAKGAQG